MASVTEPQPKPAASQRAEERLVDEQIKRTRRALKIVDLTAGMITLVIGVMMFLLTAAVLEHWVIPGGWSSTARSVLFVLLVIGAAYYSFRVLWPLLRQPINAAYAAQAIEQSSPALKNSLLNFLLLRNRKRLISRQVFQAIEHQAAQGISKISLDTVIDRSVILRLGYVLLAVVAVCAIYLLLSPKDLVTSAGRVLLPWSNVAVPSRVQLSNITPGNTQIARGDQLEVAVEVHGLDEDEPVRLLFSTADKQIVGQEIPMTSSTEGLLYKAKLPGRMSESSGVQQDLTYWIEAGDARSKRFELTVFARPTLVVQSIRYNYPNYTGYPSREESNTGDISAVEGTVVTITAMSNQPISTGHVDFEANGRHDLLMKAEDRKATVRFPLELNEDRRTPRYQSYMLRYSTTEGRKNKLPPKYQIDVTPDYSPEVRLLSPEDEIVDVLIDEQVTIEVEARDPDFAVRSVEVLGEVGGEQVLKESLLSANHTGRFVGRMNLTPSEIGLKVGDVLEYWGAAADNRRPKANLAFTSRRKIRVVGPQDEDQQQSEDPGEGDGPSQPGEGEGQQDKSDEGSEGKSDESGGEESEDSEGNEGGEGEGQEGQGQSGAGEEGEGMSDKQDQQQGGEGQPGESNEDNQDSQSKSDGKSGGDSEGDQQNSDSAGSEDGDSEGESSEGQQGSEQEKVSPDGDDDGKAFERMAEHFNEQEGKESNEPSEMKQQEGDEGQQQSRENNSDAADGKADSNQNAQDTDGEPAEASKSEDSNAADGNQQPAEKEGSDAEGESKEGNSEEGEAQEGEKQQGQEEAPEGQMPQDEESAGEGNKGTGQQESGEQGADKQEGGQKPQDQNPDQEKQGEQSAQGEPSDQEADSESRDNSQSDTKGSDGGDRSGEGSKGSGQKSEGSGTGSEGEHQAADEGGGEADQPGEGNKSGEPGDKDKADGETGKSSKDQPGNGSEQGDKTGEQAGEGKQSEQKNGSGEEGKSKPGSERSESQDGKPQNSTEGENPASPAGQQPSGSGQNNSSTPPPSAGETQAGDEANLDYARKQTDLILDKLEDQLKKNEPDKDLLEKLGWSKEELQRFVERWKNLKQSERNGEPSDKQQELDDALRSLGLGRDRQTGFQSKTAKDKLRELQDSYRGKTPLKYQQRLRAYIKGTAAAEEE